MERDVERDMDLLLKVTFFAVATAMFSLAVLVLGWRVAWGASDRPVRWAIRGGSMMAVISMGTVGVAEAGLLGFDPDAVIAVVLIGGVGFGLGAVFGAVAGVITGQASNLWR